MNRAGYLDGREDEAVKGAKAAATAKTEDELSDELHALQDGKIVELQLKLARSEKISEERRVLGDAMASAINRCVSNTQAIGKQAATEGGTCSQQ